MKKKRKCSPTIHFRNNLHHCLEITVKIIETGAFSQAIKACRVSFTGRLITFYQCFTGYKIRSVFGSRHVRKRIRTNKDARVPPFFGHRFFTTNLAYSSPCSRIKFHHSNRKEKRNNHAQRPTSLWSIISCSLKDANNSEETFVAFWSSRCRYRTFIKSSIKARSRLPASYFFFGEQRIFRIESLFHLYQKAGAGLAPRILLTILPLPSINNNVG